jgi:hypothetical protein
MSEPQYGQAYRMSVGLIELATGTFMLSPPLATGDFRISKDFGAFADLGTLPTVTPANSGQVQVSLSATEMTAAHLLIVARDPDGIWQEVLVEMHTTQMVGSDGGVRISSDPQPVLGVNVLELAGDASSPVILDRSVRTMVRGVVATGATVTVIPTSSLTPAAVSANEFVSRVVIFDEDTLTPALRGTATDITASTATGELSVSTLPVAPVEDDTFLIV